MKTSRSSASGGKDARDAASSPSPRDESQRRGPDGVLDPSGPRLRAGRALVPIPDLQSPRTLTHAGDRRADFPVGTRITIAGGELGYFSVIAVPVFDGTLTRLQVAPDEITGSELRVQ